MGDFLTQTAIETKDLQEDFSMQVRIGDVIDTSDGSIYMVAKRRAYRGKYLWKFKTFLETHQIYRIEDHEIDMESGELEL